MDSKAVIMLQTAKEVEIEVNGKKENVVFEFEFSMQYGAPFKSANEALYDFIEEVARQAKQAMKRQSKVTEPETEKGAEAEGSEEALRQDSQSTPKASTGAAGQAQEAKTDGI